MSSPSNRSRTTNGKWSKVSAMSALVHVDKLLPFFNSFSFFLSFFLSYSRRSAAADRSHRSAVFFSANNLDFGLVLFSIDGSANRVAAGFAFSLSLSAAVVVLICLVAGPNHINEEEEIPSTRRRRKNGTQTRARALDEKTFSPLPSRRRRRRRRRRRNAVLFPNVSRVVSCFSQVSMLRSLN